jgi:hypothetical protein
MEKSIVIRLDMIDDERIQISEHVNDGWTLEIWVHSLKTIMYTKRDDRFT